MRAVGLGEEVGEAQAEVVSDALEAAERDAASTVLDVGERRGRDPNVPRLLAQGPPMLLAKTSDTLADDLGRLVARLLRRDTPNRRAVTVRASRT